MSRMNSSLTLPINWPMHFCSSASTLRNCLFSWKNMTTCASQTSTIPTAWRTGTAGTMKPNNGRKKPLHRRLTNWPWTIPTKRWTRSRTKKWSSDARKKANKHASRQDVWLIKIWKLKPAVAFNLTMKFKHLSNAHYLLCLSLSLSFSRLSRFDVIGALALLLRFHDLIKFIAPRTLWDRLTFPKRLTNPKSILLSLS